MKVAVIGEIHQSGWETLKKENFDVIDVKNFDEKNLIEELKDVDGILLRTSKLEENVLNSFKELGIACHCLIRCMLKGATVVSSPRYNKIRFEKKRFSVLDLFTALDPII